MEKPCTHPPTGLFPLGPDARLYLHTRQRRAWGGRGCFAAVIIFTSPKPPHMPRPTTQGIRISATTQAVTPETVTLYPLADSVVAAAGSVQDMACYCACPLPYDNTYTAWVAVFTEAIGPSDKPMHANRLPFPLYLPLYPLKDLFVVAFAVERATSGMPLPVYLHWPSPDTLTVTRLLDLTPQLWSECMPAWTGAVSSLSMGSWLSYAFDSTWDLQVSASPDEDMFVEQDVKLDSTGPTVATIKTALHVVGSTAAPAPDLVPSADDEDEDVDEDADGNRGGEFGSFPLLHAGGDTSSESEYTESETEDEKEDEDDTDEDAQDDDIVE